MSTWSCRAHLNSLAYSSQVACTDLTEQQRTYCFLDQAYVPCIWEQIDPRETNRLHRCAGRSSRPTMHFDKKKLDWQHRVIHRNFIQLINSKDVPLLPHSVTYWLGFGQKLAFARATVILCSLVIWFSRKFRSWMVLFKSLLDQFVSRFDRANKLSIFQFDSLTFQQ